MKKIYIVLTYTGTILSKIIKNYTHDEFAHVSIGLDEKLDEMYSFGRLIPWTPLIAGFVREPIHDRTFKRFPKTVTTIYSLEITDEQYKKVKEAIYDIQKRKYGFNIIGLFAVGFNKRIAKKNQFYCAEFVKYVLDTAEINNNLPELIKPDHFKELKNTNIIYHGLLKEYN